MSMKIAYAPAVRGPNFVARAAIASVIACVRGLERTKVADSLYPKDEKTMGLLTRANATIGTTTVSGWASQLAQNSFGDFLVGLAPMSAAAKLIELGTPALVNPYATAIYPARSGAPTQLDTSKNLPMGDVF